MKQFRKRYNTFVAAVFLLAYISLLTENLFHIHHYNLSFKVNPVSYSNVDSHDDPYALGTSVCFLNYICNTINLDNFTADDILFFTSGFNFTEKPETSHFSNLKINSQSLRAPPDSKCFNLG